jgi:hypothetical protein
MDIINTKKLKNNMYRTATENLQTVLQLPPYHCEINPNEVV